MNETIKVNAYIGATIFRTQTIIYIQLYSFFFAIRKSFCGDLPRKLQMARKWRAS